MRLDDIRPSWLAARSRNAVRRPSFLGGAAAGALITALAALMALPAQKRASAPRASQSVDTDTLTLVGAVAQARAREV